MQFRSWKYTTVVMKYICMFFIEHVCNLIANNNIILYDISFGSVIRQLYFFRDNLFLTGNCYWKVFWKFRFVYKLSLGKIKYGKFLVKDLMIHS